MKEAEGVVEGASAARPRLETREPLEKNLEMKDREGGSGEVVGGSDELLEAPTDVYDGEGLAEAVHPHLLDRVVAEGVVGVVQEAAGKEELHPPRHPRLNRPASPLRWRRSRSVDQALRLGSCVRLSRPP